MWVKFQHKESRQSLYIAVCYFPPVGTSHDGYIEDRFQALSGQIQRFQLDGQVVVCGDFNARCGVLNDVGDVDKRVGGRVSLDKVSNDQGEMLVECLQNSGPCIVNGRKGNDDFTCISKKGAFVVDYCLVPLEELDNITAFSVKTMSHYEKNSLSSRGGLSYP